MKAPARTWISATRRLGPLARGVQAAQSGAGPLTLGMDARVRVREASRGHKRVGGLDEAGAADYQMAACAWGARTVMSYQHGVCFPDR